MTTPERLRGRQRALAEAVAGRATLLTNPVSVRYVSGFSGSNGWLVLHGRELHLLTDERYRTQAPLQAPDAQVHIAADGLPAQLAVILPGGTSELLVEADDLTLSTSDDLAARLAGVRLVPGRGLVEGLRSRKDSDELGRIEQALALTEEALLEVFSGPVAGETESALAARLDYACRRRGAERMAFDTILAVGVNGALPHARPGATVLQANVPIVVDCGCVLDGYCSDISRTAVAGDLDERWQAIHYAVDQARLAAVAAAAPGVATAELDAVARAVLESHGLAEFFVHSLGHGVGLEVHEKPRISRASQEVLEAGMVITIEPGVYIPGEAGLRLEDMVVITDGAARRLNRTGTAPLRSAV